MGDFLLNTSYGKWTIITENPLRGGKSVCRCSCGVQQEVANYQLVKGRSSSCKSCASKKREDKNRKYPASARLLSLRQKVMNALSRCTDPSNEKYKHYGARGIKVFPEWVVDKPAFVKYLMTLPGWDNKDLELDREDNNGHYEPGNLRFVTKSESMKNRRRWGTSERTKRRHRRLEQ